MNDTMIGKTFFDRINLLKNLSVLTKLALSTGIFLLVIGFVSYELLKKWNEDVDTIRSELVGVQYIDPIYQIIQQLQIHRGQSNAFLNGAPLAREAAETAARKADQSLVNLLTLIDQQKDPVNIRQNIVDLQESWQRLSQKSFQGPAADIFAEHSDLIGRFIRTIVLISDRSSLTMDSEFDSLYLVISVAFRNHFLAEALGKIRGTGTGMIASGNLSKANLVKLAMLVGTVNIGGVEDSFANIYAANPALKDQLGATTDSMLEASRSFMDYTMELVNENITVSSDEFFQAGTKAVNQIFTSTPKLTAALTSLLQTRLDTMMVLWTRLVFSLVIGLCISLLVLLVTIVGINRSLKQVVGIFALIEKGKYDNKFFVSSKDELGQLQSALQRMQATLKDNVEKQQRISSENIRIRQALDNVSTGAMVADDDANIVYINRSAKRLMIENEAKIKRDLPNFNGNELIGKNIDLFHKKPAHQRNLLAGLTGSYDTEIGISGLTFGLTASPVFDDHGNRIGSVLEWRDRTVEVAIEKEIDQLIESATNGDLTVRVVLEGKTGFYRKLAEGLNSLLVVSEGVVNETARMFESLASGNLRQRINTDYKGTFNKLKNDANATVDKLTDVLSRISDAANTVSTAADEIAHGNMDLSQRTEEQASSLEETASSMEQMTGTVKQSAEHAYNVNIATNEAKKQAQIGGGMVEQTISAISEINRSSKQISDIITVIDDIAFQTNLLALNAAVEAARAGEQGRGFAVVASEVRSLAQRSASAAKEIKDLIRDSVEKVEQGTELVNESGKTLLEIVTAIEKVSSMINDISNSAQEQTAGIEQVNQAVSQMDTMTQQNAALVEQASAAGQTMAEQARNMINLIEFFQIENSATGTQGKRPLKTVSAMPSRKAVNKNPVKTTKSSDEWEDF
ncbi:methyl-accepting chemotaxis protein [Gynuella sunshinyii]|uniref:Methyl-accepting chemotaxis protein n=1 Tax=Gynuella sunshinyii YC6258 TaxID=1445510 RepID=A0A0C5VSM2_9GAMM|nr:methyl-accepting chemotaxis protein [Gynuella sunshinyii]AJQ96328.1 methyl-accepting chemotaxis protein [Gynuella sunshinyii YC6258]